MLFFIDKTKFAHIFVALNFFLILFPINAMNEHSETGKVDSAGNVKPPVQLLHLSINQTHVAEREHPSLTNSFSPGSWFYELLFKIWMGKTKNSHSQNLGKAQKARKIPRADLWSVWACCVKLVKEYTKLGLRNWGGSMGWWGRRLLAIIIMYLQHSSRVKVESVCDSDNILSHWSFVHWYHLGLGLESIKLSKIRPMGGLSIGLISMTTEWIYSVGAELWAQLSLIFVIVSYSYQSNNKSHT